MRGFFIKLIGHKKREEIDLKKINSILIGGGRVGDIITKTPMFRAFSELNKNIKIDVTVAKGCESLLINHPNVNVISSTEISRFSKIKIYKIIHNLFSSFKIRKKYDLYFDFTRNVRFFHILSLKIMKPRYLIGCYRMEKFGIKKDELTIFDKYIDGSAIYHAVDINMMPLEVLGINTSNKKYELFLGPLETKFENYFNKNKINIIFNFLGSAQNRCLCDEDIEYFFKELPKLNNNIELYILTTPIIYEKIKRKVEFLNLKHVHLLPKTESILEAAALIKYCSCLFSVDTGIIHLASVFNIPTLGLYTEDKDTLTIFAPKSDLYKIVIGKKEDYLKFENKEYILEETLKLLNEIINK